MGRGFKPHRRYCFVSLRKNINPSLVLVQPRKTHPYINERLLMGCKESKHTNEILKRCPMYEPFKIQCIPFTTHLNITLICIQHSHVVAPIFFYKGILQRHCRKMTMKWSFSYNLFVKLSLYNMFHL